MHCVKSLNDKYLVAGELGTRGRSFPAFPFMDKDKTGFISLFVCVCIRWSFQCHVNVWIGTICELKVEHGLVMYSTLKCLEKFDKLRFQFSTTTFFVGWFCSRRKIEQFCCRKKSEMVWKWSVYGELCLYIVRSYGHILPNTSINTISPDLTLIYDTKNIKNIFIKCFPISPKL